MTMVHQKVLASAIDKLYVCATDENSWPDALQAIGRLFDSPRVGLLRTSAEVDRVLEMRSFNFDAETQALYNRHYWKLDPTLERSRRARPGDWEDCSYLFDPRTTRDAEYVVDYAIPRGLRYVAGGKVHADAACCVILGLQRPADARPFPGEAQALFGCIRPHLQRVSLISHELQTAKRRVALSTAAIDGLAQPAYVVSRDANVLFSNAFGLRQLQLQIPFRPHNDRLRLCAANAALFDRALRRATSGTPRIGTDIMEVSEGQQWIIRVAPMPEDPASALVYASLASRPAAPPFVLQQVFGLTKAEAEIAFSVAEGLTVKEIAYQRDVSELTIRAQVRCLLAKTGARRLSALAVILNSLPALRADGEKSKESIT